MDLDTLPKNLLHARENFGPDQVAMRQKDRGIWMPYTWEDSYRTVRGLSLGLMEMGLRPGDKVCIIGDNDPQYFWAQIAIQAAGAVAVGIFTDSTPAEIEYIVDHSDAVLVFAKDQEQCDKMLDIRDQIPDVRGVIYWDEKGLWNYDTPWLLEFGVLVEKGTARAQAEPGEFERVVSGGEGEDLAIFCYTSGTTGRQKAVMISHSNLLSGCDLTRAVDPREPRDEYLSFLPPAWITENVLGLTMHLRAGMIVNFPEAPETVQENIREIAPHALLFSARLWESMVAMVQMKISETTWLNRALYRLFMPLGYRLAHLKYEQGVDLNPAWRALNAIGEAALFRPLRDKLGLTRIISAYSSGAALNPDVIRFFRAIGVNIKQLYGSTEAQTHTLHIGDDVRFETVGVPLPGMDVRVAETGEIWVSGPSVFRGYYKNPEATEQAIMVDQEGRRWFRTGDAGTFNEDSHLIYLDRMQDMISLSSGEAYSPQYIEGRLKFSPYIKDVMTVGGEDLPFVTALLNIDFDNVGRWAERQGIAYTTYVDLAQKPQVYALIREDVEAVNRTLPEAARVHRFVLLHKEFDPDEAELTRTRKLRRKLLSERYQEMISAMYGGREAVQVRAAVKYRDGREGTVEREVRVEALDREVAGV
jgi:long-chain acyl-CoA synthetase